MSKRKKYSRKEKKLKLCKRCKTVYTSEKSGICITCQSKDWLRIK